MASKGKASCQLVPQKILSPEALPKSNFVQRLKRPGVGDLGLSMVIQLPFYNHPSGHVDGFYEPSRAEGALANGSAAVAELLETPPWCPTAEEQFLGRTMGFGDSMMDAERRGRWGSMWRAGTSRDLEMGASRFRTIHQERGDRSDKTQEDDHLVGES